MLGDTERVSYDPKNPNNARDPSNGATKWLWIGIGISVLVMVIGVWTFFVRLVELAGGLILLHWGFKRRHQVKRGEAPTTGPRAGSVMASVGKWMQAMAEKRSLSEPGSFLTGDEGSDPLAHLANEAATVLGRRSARTA